MKRNDNCALPVMEMQKYKIELNCILINEMMNY